MSLKKNKYDYKFYEGLYEGSKYSADKVLGILQKYMKISSVIDVGGVLVYGLKSQKRSLTFGQKMYCY